MVMRTVLLICCGKKGTKILSFVNVHEPQIFKDPAGIVQMFDCLGIRNL